MKTEELQKTEISADHLKTSARALAHLLSESRPYQDFMAAYQQMKASEAFQSLSRQIEDLQTRAEMDVDNQKDLIKQMDDLMSQLESLPVVTRYYEQEEVLCAFLAEVDSIISREAGISFSLNARRTRCSCNS